MSGLKRVARRGPNNRMPASPGDFGPQRAYPPRVRLRGHDDHCGTIFPREFVGNRTHFVRGVVDRRLQYVDRLRGHTLTHQNTRVVEVLAEKRYMYGLQRSGWLACVRQPYL